ncbi:MAG: LamG-like jellyroll fold domain-containing protein [Opitutales bacterium]
MKIGSYISCTARSVLLSTILSMGAHTTVQAHESMHTHPGVEHDAHVAAFEFVPDTDIFGFPFEPLDLVTPKGGLTRVPPALAFYGEMPTDRRLLPVSEDDLDLDAFSIEFWISYHVNQPVSALALAYEENEDEVSSWHFGLRNGEVIFGLGKQILMAPAIEVKGTVPHIFDPERYTRGANRYWHHLVGTYDGKLLSIFQNGKLIGQAEVDEKAEEATILELAGYLGREPYMDLGAVFK